MPEIDYKYRLSTYDWSREILGGVLMLTAIGIAYYFSHEMQEAAYAQLESETPITSYLPQPYLWGGVTGAGILYLFLFLLSLAPEFINHDPNDSPEDIREAQLTGVKFTRAMRVFIAIGLIPLLQTRP